MESRVVLSLEARQQELVTLQEIRRVARVSPGYARKIAHDLVRKGWLQRARPGEYVLNPARNGPDAIPDSDPLPVGRHLSTPYYFGFATAAELLGFLPQVGRVYFLATPGPSKRVVRGSTVYRLIHARGGAIWGTRTLRRRGQQLVVSDPEHTVLDSLDRPRLSGGLPGVARILFAAKPRMDWRRLDRYVRRLGNRSLARRLGYLVEQIRPDVRAPEHTVRAWLPRAADPYVPLGPLSQHGRRGRHDARWRVIENVDRDHLLGEIRHR
jgi:predicted transcriptional regulator of viral defense system